MSRKVGRWPCITATLLLGMFGLNVAPALVSAQPSSTVPSGEFEVGNLERSIVYLGITWQGYVQYPTTSGELKWSSLVEAQASCTGWFVNPEGYIVTAGHCVETGLGKDAILRTFLSDADAMDLYPEASGTWKVEGRNEGSPPERQVIGLQSDVVSGSVIDSPKTLQWIADRPYNEGDVALLKMSGLPEPAPALSIAAETPDVGDVLTAIGYPGDLVETVDTSRVPGVSFKTGSVSSHQVTPNGVAVIEINADMGPGMSGGPTVNAQGAVVGVNSYTIGQGRQAFNFITDTGDLKVFLEVNGVEPAIEEAPAPIAASEPVTSGVPIPLIAVIVAAAIAVGGGLWLLVRRRKPASQIVGGVGAATVATPQATTDTAAPPVSNPPTQPSARPPSPPSGYVDPKDAP